MTTKSEPPLRRYSERRNLATVSGGKPRCAWQLVASASAVHAATASAAYLGSAADCLRNFPTNFAILGDAEEAWTDHASDTPSARCLHRCMTRLNTLLEERQARAPLPQDILKRDYPTSATNLGEAKRKLQRRVTSLEVDLAWHETLLGNAHTRASPAALTGPARVRQHSCRRCLHCRSCP